MTNRSLGKACVLMVALAVSFLIPEPVSSQDGFRTAWGDPDLRGIWTNTTTTPLERPDDLEGQAVLTDEERVTRDEERAQRADRPPPPGRSVQALYPR